MILANIADSDATFALSLSTLVALIGAVWRLSAKVAITDVKVNTMWDYHIRRSVVAGISNESLKANSPIRATPKGEEMFQGLKDELQQWYVNGKKSTLNDRDLFIAIERDFGKRLITEVALPNNIAPGEAVAVAVALCREFVIP